MLPRFHIGPLLMAEAASDLLLPESAARHVQVLRMQPGDVLQVFDGQGGEWRAVVTEMGRKHVRVRLADPLENRRELPVQVTLAVGMPANDRMDALVEKATELGVHAIQPLMCQRSVLRLDGERAAKKVAHWQAVAVAASEQCGRAVVPEVRPVQALGNWLNGEAEALEAETRRIVLSLRQAVPLRRLLAESEGRQGGWVFLNGPEGGLTEEEEAQALARGWQAVSLGSRVLRADTAPLAALSVIGAHAEA